ncbi:MAG: inositol monophosphatase [Ignavibacteria bacterium]|nr:inositol monophosphatase [Ignavibacteria bacterium]MBT8382661.1 inositol monophosphatase [Ignavibacteria bacterium]MBT8391224.1 inositol monophosphatase [Ignavibacteria bacterium]NNJ54429.1 inositol monophosphatase [Ignavibacteriaceae bacterium]NNL22451.1 inositol monophosphatase [Ignavibacteriaceae bacterium]
MINDLINISQEAGQLIKEKFGKNLEIEFKTNEMNLVTEADKASEKLITEFIRKKYPSHGVLAEEGSEFNISAKYLWVVDPLDGTTNFAHGLPIFSVSIGLQKNGQTIAGVVYDINQNIIYAAELGSGAIANDKKIKVSTNSNLGHSMLVTGFPYDVKDNPNKSFERFIAMIKSSRAVRRLGSAAIDFCYVAKGVFDGFWEVHLHPWDICAGKLIVEEASGSVTDFGGKQIDIYSKRILCSNGNIHESMIQKLNEV